MPTVILLLCLLLHYVFCCTLSSLPRSVASMDIQSVHKLPSRSLLFSTSAASATSLQTWTKFSNMRLCTGSPTTAPFVQGVYLAGGKVARVTVFDVEVHQIFRPGTNDWDFKSPPFISLLMFVETDASINHTQWKDRALAVGSRLGDKMQLRCSFSSVDAGNGRETLIHESDALVLHPPFKRFLNVHCPIAEDEENIETLSSSLRFSLKLTLKSHKNRILHLEPLPLCRDDGFLLPPIRRQPWRDSASPLKPLEYSRKETKEEAGEGDREVKVSEPAEKTTVALCVRPYHEHHFFDTVSLSHSDERLLEYIDYHLLLGVSRVYFYDRYGAEKIELLQPYIDRNLLVYIPFPVWSEVFYRKERFNDALYPYNFPLIYDQVLVYEHCLIQGRRNGDTWMFFTDTDEFLWYPEKTVGALPVILEKMTKEYERRHLYKSIGSIGLKRFNFGGANGSGDPVLDSCTQRCRGPIYNLVHDWNLIKYKDKLGAQPGQMVGSIIDVHEANGKVQERFVDVEPSVLRINHYSSAPFSEYKGEKGTAVGSPCNKVEDPWQLEFDWVEDTSLMWAADRLTMCTKVVSCEEFTKGECGFLCPTI